MNRPLVERGTGEREKRKGLSSPFPFLFLAFFFQTESQKKSSNTFRIRIFLFLSSSFGIRTINTFMRSRSSLENYTRFQTKMGKVYTRFQTKTAPKPNPMAWHIPIYITYNIREYPPPPGTGPMFVTRSSLFLSTFTNT